MESKTQDKNKHGAENKRWPGRAWDTFQSRNAGRKRGLRTHSIPKNKSHLLPLEARAKPGEVELLCGTRIATHATDAPPAPEP